MTYPPPTAATGDYSSHTDKNATYLPPAAAGPDAADEIQTGGRENHRRPISRLLRRRPSPDGPEAIPGRPAAARFTGASRRPQHSEGLPRYPGAPGSRAPGDPGAPGAGHRPLHRADRAGAEHPGISWSAARPGLAPVASEDANERLDPHRAAQEHPSAFRPDHGRATIPARPPAKDPALEPAWDRMLAGLATHDLTLVKSLLLAVEKLEGHEENPAQLELLFRIDHLATRMRRNSENLLVLAGQGGEDRGAEPVPLLDVVRTAISGITEYSRAQISALPDVKLIGPSADDVSHILAELLDNATSKSPDSPS